MPTFEINDREIEFEPGENILAAALRMGIDIPYYALKRLVNHSMSGDVTAGYIVRNVERLRDPMQRISDEIERLCQPSPGGHN